VRTLGELIGLADDTARIWWRRFPVMGFWFCLGFAAHAAGTVGSAVLGARYGVLATIVFVVGVMGLVLALILMIDACFPALRTIPQLAQDPLGRGGLPGSVIERQPRLTMIGVTIGPFLAVYALWGLVEEQVRDIYFINIALLGSAGGDEWSVDLRRFRFYLVLAVVCWILRQLVGTLSRRLGATWLLFPGVLLEGLWVFASFLALTGAASRLLDWLRTRAVWEFGASSWRGFVDALPDLALPWDLTLPRAVAAVGDWLWHSLLPGVGTAVALPLVWLALTVTVFGWHQATARELLAGTRIESRINRASAGLQRRRQGVVGLAAHHGLDLLTADLRTKYLPVAHALRLILRAGPAFLGAYLVLATLVVTLRAFVSPLLDVAMGAQNVAWSLAGDPFTELGLDLIFTTISVALYVAAVDRLLAASAGLEWTPRPTGHPVDHAAGRPVTGGPPAAPAPSTDASGR